MCVRNDWDEWVWEERWRYDLQIIPISKLFQIREHQLDNGWSIATLCAQPLQWTTEKLHNISYQRSFRTVICTVILFLRGRKCSRREWCKDQDFTNFMFPIVYLLFCIVHARICRITAWDAMRNQASVITRRSIKRDARRDYGETRSWVRYLPHVPAFVPVSYCELVSVAAQPTSIYSTRISVLYPLFFCY